MVAESEDIESGNYWYYGTKVSFQEVAESWWLNPISLGLNTPSTDVLHPPDNTSNSEDYSLSLYELNIQAGSTYAVSVERPTGLNTQLALYMSSLYDDDVYHYNDYEIEYLYNGAERGSLVFMAINTTTVELYASVYNYSHALITDGQIEIIAWELDANQSNDDYLNASDVAAGNSTGYVDYLTDYEIGGHNLYQQANHTWYLLISTLRISSASTHISTHTMILQIGVSFLRKSDMVIFNLNLTKSDLEN